MGWGASQLREEAQSPPALPPPLTAHLLRCDRQLTVQRVSVWGPGEGVVFVFSAMPSSSPLGSLSGSVWVFWKQLEETAGYTRENV